MHHAVCVRIGVGKAHGEVSGRGRSAGLANVEDALSDRTNETS